MALIKCTECGKQTSEYAESCPNCGCPIDVIRRELGLLSAEEIEEEEKREKHIKELLDNIEENNKIIEEYEKKNREWDKENESYLKELELRRKRETSPEEILKKMMKEKEEEYKKQTIKGAILSVLAGY